MTVQEVIKARLTGFAGLTALVSTRVHPGDAPQNSTRPYVTYQVISAPPEYGFGGSIGIISARFQFDVFAAGYDSACAVVEQLKEALEFWANPSSTPEIIRVLVIDGGSDGYEPDTGFYHPTIDFQVIYRE